MTVGVHNTSIEWRSLRRFAADCINGWLVDATTINVLEEEDVSVMSFICLCVYACYTPALILAAPPALRDASVCVCP